MSRMAAALAYANLKCPQCGYALTGLSRRTCPECGGAFDMSTIEHARRRERRRRWLVSALIMAAAIYLPFSWLLWGGVWTDSQHWLWLTLWPILPGLPVTILLRFALHHQLPEWGEFVCMGLFTLAVLMLVTWLGTRGRWWLVSTAVIVFALSCFNGWIGYVLFQL
jgi:hypothetical protein